MKSRRRTPEERYQYNIRKQQEALDRFVEYEVEWAEILRNWYRVKKQDIPDDEYRACAFFMNGEYLHKPGSLTLCYEMNKRCQNELPEFTKEQALELLRFRYKSYANVLKIGGFS